MELEDNDIIMCADEKGKEKVTCEKFTKATFALIDNGGKSKQLPVGRQGHTAVLHNENLIIFAGRVVGKGRVYTNDMWSFNIPSKVWSTVAMKGIIPVARHNHSAVLFNNCIYVFGGSNNDEYFNDLYAFDLLSLSWTKLNPNVIFIIFV